MHSKQHLKPHALLINLYFPPDTSATAAVFLKVVESLIDRGHAVTVLCGRLSYQTSLPLQNPKRIAGRAVVVRVNSTRFARHRMAGRIANYLSFFFLAGVRALLMRRPDVVISGSDPPFAVWIAQLAARRRPVVYSLRDLHPEFAIASKMIKPGVITRAWEAIHTAGLKRCARVICLGEDMAERVASKGVPRDRISVVYDGAPRINGQVDPKVVKDLRGTAAFTVSHCGNLGGAGAWETLIDSASRINGDTSCFFVGAGSQEDLVKRSGVRLLSFRPPSELASVMAAGDLQVVSLRRGMAGLVVPSKLWTALAYGRPVLAVVPKESEVARIVEEWRCGVVADPDDPDDVVKKIEWARAHPQALEEMSANALEAARHFDRHRQLQRFVSLVEQAANSNGRRARDVVLER